MDLAWKSIVVICAFTGAAVWVIAILNVIYKYLVHPVCRGISMYFYDRRRWPDRYPRSFGYLINCVKRSYENRKREWKFGGNLSIEERC